MIPSEEIWRCLISNQEKKVDNLQSQNKINGNFGKNSKEQALCRFYGTLHHVLKRVLN